MLEQQLTFAARALAAGNLAASEIACRDVLDLDRQNSSALHMLGVIAARLGMPGHAAAYLKAAVRADPGNAEARANLNRLKNAPRRRGTGNPESPKFLLIKSWGYGFWSDVSQVLGSLLLAEITGRIPVTHWGGNSLFGDGSSGDAFALFFKPVSNVTLQDLAQIDGATFFPPKWNRANLTDDNVAKWDGHGSRAAAVYFLNRPETIAVSDFYIGVVNVAPWITGDHPMHGKPLEEIYRYLVDKYLIPHAVARSAWDAFFRVHLEGLPFVAVHMRGSDKIVEDPDVHATNQSFLSALASIDPTWRIFLLTDEEQYRARIKAVYGDRVIATTCQRTSTSTGVHYLPSVNRVQAGLEVMTDTYLALRANRFIGNGRSNVSAIIAVLKEWKPGDCLLIGRSLLLERNLFVYVKS
jgi:protein O-GlcNAc transferase